MTPQERPMNASTQYAMTTRTMPIRSARPTMQALVYRKYGAPEVVGLASVAKPVPSDHEVLIRVRATTVSTADWRARTLAMPPGFAILGRLFFGVFGPRKKVLGTELAGEIEAIGKGVTRFQVGESVFAFCEAGYGAHAQYRTMSETGLVARKPAALSFEQAAALSFGGTTAHHFLARKGRIARGDKVLVVGASGAVGSAAVQLARHFGADVTGVTSTANVDLVRSLGAQHVVDYTKDDFARSGETYDIILDTTGSAPLSRAEASLKPGGRLLVVLSSSFGQALGLARPAKGSGKKVIAGVAVGTPDQLQFLAKLAEAGEFVPVIDRVYPWERAAEAHARVDSGRKTGSVVLTVGA
jgi:NADPH:quinone reductase-like Zn-dependent oxidoreductase